MKTRKITKLLYASVCTLLFGCSTGDVEGLDSSAEDRKFIVRGSIENREPSRAEMSEEGLKFSFSVADADRIGVYVAYPAADWTDHNLCFEAFSSTDGWVDFKQISTSTAAFQQGLNVYAYSPYLEAQPQVSGSTEGATDTRTAVSGNWSGTRNLEIPAEQIQSAGGDFSHLTRYYALAAAPTTVYNDADNNPTVKLNFSGVFALLRVRLFNSTTQPVTISKVDFEVGENQNLTGLYTADLTADPRFANAAYATTPVAGRTGNKVSVALTAPATLEAGADTYVYMVVHPLTVNNCSITAWTTDGFKFVELKTYEGNAVVPLQRDIRRTFLCTLSDSNKVSQDAPALNAEGFYEVSSLENIVWVAQNATQATRKYKIMQSLDVSTSGQTLRIDSPAVFALGEGSTLTVAANQIQNNSELTVSGAGTLAGDYGLLVNNSGATLTLDGNTTLVTTNNQIGSGILNKGGNVVIEDCTVNAAFYAIANSAGGKLNIHGGTFSSTSHNGDGQWAYCIRSTGAGTETVIDYAEVSGVQGAVTVDAGAKLTINDGVFSSYDLSGTGNNYHALAVLDNGYALVNGGKFYSERHDYCVRIGADDPYAATDTSTIELKGGYYGDQGLDKISGGTTIIPAAGYKFVPLDTPLTESSVTVPGRTDTYKYRIVAE